MLNIPAIYQAWQAGNIIKDPEKWKARCLNEMNKDDL